MSQSDDGQDLRLVVDGIDDSVYDLTAAEARDTTGSTDSVRASRSSNADRAAGQRRYEVTIDGWVFSVTVESLSRALLRERAGKGNHSQGQKSEQVIKAQIPGRVVRLWVAEGDTVEAGQRLLSIEAMKMENEVRAPHAGIISKVKVSVGGSVELGNELVTVG